MARFVTGETFGTTDTVTATKLNNAVNNAAISTDSVDNNTIEVNSNALRLKDSSSKTTGVTFTKMQHISTAQVLGRVSASEGDVEEVGIVIGGSGDAGLLFDNDDMLDNSDTAGGSATRGATQQSIKAYVDSHGISQSSGSAPYFGCRAFGTFNGQATSPITPESAGNIASIVRTSTGAYAITFTTEMPGVNYCVVANENHSTSSSFGTSTTVSSRTTTGFNLRTGEANTGAGYNPDNVAFCVFA